MCPKIGGVVLGGIPDTLPKAELLIWSQSPDIRDFVVCKNCLTKFDKIPKKFCVLNDLKLVPWMYNHIVHMLLKQYWNWTKIGCFESLQIEEPKAGDVILTMRWPIPMKIGEVEQEGIPDTLPKAQLLIWSQSPDIGDFVLCENCLTKFDKIRKNFCVPNDLKLVLWMYSHIVHMLLKPHWDWMKIGCSESLQIAGPKAGDGILTRWPMLLKIGGVMLGGLPDTLPEAQLLMWSQSPDIWDFVLCKNSLTK